MNGRVYSPKLGRMLSPDPLTQAPENGQNYDRYSYAFNNPLKFADPSGFVSFGCSVFGCGVTIDFGDGGGGSDSLSTGSPYPGFTWPSGRGGGNSGADDFGGIRNDLDYTDRQADATGFYPDGTPASDGCIGELSLGGPCIQLAEAEVGDIGSDFEPVEVPGIFEILGELIEKENIAQLGLDVTLTIGGNVRVERGGVLLGVVNAQNGHILGAGLAFLHGTGDGGQNVLKAIFGVNMQEFKGGGTAHQISEISHLIGKQDYTAAMVKFAVYGYEFQSGASLFDRWWNYHE